MIDTTNSTAAGFCDALSRITSALLGARSLSLHELEITLDSNDVPDDVEAFIAHAEAEIQRFFDLSHEDERQRVAQSDFRLVWSALQAIQHQVPRCSSFCEWGSGFGVNSALAATLGMKAVGIELDASILMRARMVCKDLPNPPQFYHGNFLPTGANKLVDALDNIWLTARDGADVYDQYGLHLSEYEIVFAYPAPGEGRFIADVFDHFGANNTLLLSFHGSNEIRLRKKR